MTSGNRLLTLAEARERKRGDPTVTGRLPRSSGPRNVQYLQRVATLLRDESAWRETVAERMNRSTSLTQARSVERPILQTGFRPREGQAFSKGARPGAATGGPPGEFDTTRRMAYSYGRYPS